MPPAAWALLQVLDIRRSTYVAAWLAAAVILHDLVLLPAYSALDRLGARATGRAVNYVRVPAGISLLLALVFLPVIAGKGERAYMRVSGLRFGGYLGRWLLATGVLFAGSGALYLIRSRSRT